MWLRVRLETLFDKAISCEASGDETDVRDEDPCLGAGDGFLPILCQSSTSVEPSESAFDDPAAGDDLEPRGAVGALDDLHRPGTYLVQRAA